MAAGAYGPRQLSDAEVIGYLEQVVRRLERLGDRIETYVEDDEVEQKGHHEQSPPSP